MIRYCGTVDGCTVCWMSFLWRGVGCCVYKIDCCVHKIEHIFLFLARSNFCAHLWLAATYTLSLVASSYQVRTTIFHHNQTTYYENKIHTPVAYHNIAYLHQWHILPLQHKGRHRFNLFNVSITGVFDIEEGATSVSWTSFLKTS